MKDYYYVFRKTNTGWQEVARTAYLEDAKAVYSQWHAAYIAFGGDIIEQKGF